MGKVTITITIDDGNVTVDQGAEDELKPFLLHPEDDLQIPKDRPVTTDEKAHAIIRENNDRFVKQMAASIAEPALGDAETLAAIEAEARK
jgi:hypothetical protein